MMTLQNVNKANRVARAISNFRPKCAPTMLISIDMQTCRDVPNDIGQEMMVEFPFLECVNFTIDSNGDVQHVAITSDTPVEVAPVIDPVDPIAALQASVPVVCNQCGKHFKNETGKKIHITSIHEKIYAKEESKQE